MAGDAQSYKAQIEPDGLAIEVDLSASIERVYVSAMVRQSCRRDDEEMWL
jgi:hypothetical protein